MPFVDDSNTYPCLNMPASFPKKEDPHRKPIYTHGAIPSCPSVQGETDRAPSVAFPYHDRFRALSAQSYQFHIILFIYFVLRARHRDPAHRFHHLINLAFLNVASLSFKISLPLLLLVAPGPNIMFKRQE